MDIDPFDPGLANPPNEFGTLASESNSKSSRAFIPEPGVMDLLKTATHFARIKIAKPMEERDMYSLLYDGPSPYMTPMKDFATYVGNTILIFSQNAQEHTDQFRAVLGSVFKRRIRVDLSKGVEGLSRDMLPAHKIQLKVVEDKRMTLVNSSDIHMTVENKMVLLSDSS